MMVSQPTPQTAFVPTILVVDDEPTIVKLCSDLLEREGFTILQATGSSDAIRCCTTFDGDIHLLLTDLVLRPANVRLAVCTQLYPHVHGHELALRIAALRKGIRILFMSGNPDGELAGYGIQQGNLPFLRKPFDQDSLLHTIGEILSAPAPTLSLIVRETLTPKDTTSTSA